MTARQLFRLGLFAIVAFALGLVAARYVLAPRPLPQTENATLFPNPRPLPALSLVDQDGRETGPELLSGHWSLVFFGFTHCPDVCPTTLGLLAQAQRHLTDLPAAERPRVLLISVDPERDTPAHLREYVRFFDPSFGAVTGTPDHVRAAADAFHVPYAKVSLPDGGYTMDHGAGVFVVSPAGKVVSYSSPPLSPEVFARDYRKTVSHYGDAG
jgi:protein SCO1/2